MIKGSLTVGTKKYTENKSLHATSMRVASERTGLPKNKLKERLGPVHSHDSKLNPSQTINGLKFVATAAGWVLDDRKLLEPKDQPSLFATRVTAAQASFTVPGNSLISSTGSKLEPATIQSAQTTLDGLESTVLKISYVDNKGNVRGMEMPANRIKLQTSEEGIGIKISFVPKKRKWSAPDDLLNLQALAIWEAATVAKNADPAKQGGSPTNPAAV